MGLFERYLSLWVALSIGLGVILGLITSDICSNSRFRICPCQYCCRCTYLADDLPNDDSG
jgi:hypothetical protein